MKKEKDKGVNLTPGTLYFINEHDVKTGERTSYYKVGIVRDSDSRNAIKRLLEHQTGNPRKLTVVSELYTPGVEYIETTLHKLYARNLIFGEWMDLTQPELNNVIKRATELKHEFELLLPSIQLVKDLSKIISNGKILPCSEEANTLAQQAHTYRSIIKTCNSLTERYREFLEEAIDEGVELPENTKKQPRAGAIKFDEKLFAERYPDLYEKYVLDKTSISGSFRYVKSKLDIEVSSVLSVEEQESLSKFSDLIESPVKNLEYAFTLQDAHLKVVELSRFAEWNEMIVKVKLQVLNGENDGIESICSWKRIEKAEQKLDSKLVKNNHPEEYAECSVQGQSTEAIIIEPRLGRGKTI